VENKKRKSQKRETRDLGSLGEVEDILIIDRPSIGWPEDRLIDASWTSVYKPSSTVIYQPGIVQLELHWMMNNQRGIVTRMRNRREEPEAKWKLARRRRRRNERMEEEKK